MALCASCLCLLGPNSDAAVIPAAASTAVKKIAAAAKAGDYATLKQLMEPTVVHEASVAPVSSNAVIAQWKAGNPSLTEISKAIQGGCELANQSPLVVVCPPAKVAQTADGDVYLIALRPNKSGTWLVFMATYAD